MKLTVVFNKIGIYTFIAGFAFGLLGGYLLSMLGLKFNANNGHLVAAMIVGGAICLSYDLFIRLMKL